MATGLTTVSAANLCDATGTKIANATIYFQPVLSNGQQTSFEAGGDVRGVVVSAPVSALVTNGAFSLSLFDTTLTNPLNIGYAVQVLDNQTGDSLLGPGYGCIQPSGSSWSLDTYVPVLAAVSVVVGAQGPAGPTVPSGTLVTNASGAPFTVGISGGELSLSSTAPVLIDSVTGQLWQVGVTLGSDGINRPSFTLVTGTAYAAVAVTGFQFYDLASQQLMRLSMASGHYVISALGAASGIGSGAYAEVPTGAIDGVNATYTLSHTPTLLTQTRNGIFQTPGIDFTLSGSTITYTTPLQPATATAPAERHFSQYVH